MKSKRVNKIICIALAVALTAAMLSGCMQGPSEPEEDQDGEVTLAPAAESPVSVADKVFTLNFDAEAGFNPLICGSTLNTEISCLIYEGLFVLDETFTAVPKLCTEYNSNDGLNWTLSLKPNVLMHDGSYLTAEDVVYSIREAKRTRYASRFNYVTDIEATDELTLTVSLSKKNYNFIALLDVPVLKNGTGRDFAPVGTGPYTYAKEASRLRAFSRYRDFDTLPLRVIYLSEYEPSKLARAFTGQVIDLIIEDPLSIASEDLSAGHELHEYDTTLFQYVGFNTENGVFTDSRMRKAVGYAVNREYIVREIMKDKALPATLVLSPALSFYDEEWEKGFGYSMSSCSLNLASVGLEDPDSDGFLELPDDTGGFVDIPIDFIVNGDSIYKVKAAQEIEYAIRSVGLDISLRILGWKEYKTALQTGDFDMYYGETLLTPDFDLTELISPGGSLNYGGYEGDNCVTAISAFLGARDGEERADAAEMLCRTISLSVPIVPVLYRKHCVRSNRGVVTGLDPSVSGVLCGIAGWKISL